MGSYLGFLAFWSTHQIANSPNKLILTHSAAKSLTTAHYVNFEKIPSEFSKSLSICLPPPPPFLSLKSVMCSRLSMALVCYFTRLHVGKLGYGHTLPHLVYAVLAIAPGASCMLGQHCTHWATSPAPSANRRYNVQTTVYSGFSSYSTLKDPQKAHWDQTW